MLGKGGNEHWTYSIWIVLGSGIRIKVGEWLVCELDDNLKMFRGRKLESIVLCRHWSNRFQLVFLTVRREACCRTRQFSLNSRVCDGGPPGVGGGGTKGQSDNQKFCPESPTTVPAASLSHSFSEKERWSSSSSSSSSSSDFSKWKLQTSFKKGKSKKCWKRQARCTIKKSIQKEEKMSPTISIF